MENCILKRLRSRLESYPVAVRVAPFLIFVFLTLGQGKLGAGSQFWVYAVKTVVGAFMLLFVWRSIIEMRWRLSLPAVGVGAAVFVMWIGLDGFVRMLELPTGFLYLAPASGTWNPFEIFGAGAGAAWIFFCVRLFGSALVVPPLEEVFYRSFLYRYIQKSDFMGVPLRGFHFFAFFAVALVFGLSHREWLAGVLCGMAYQGLVCWKGRLGDAMTAHAVTNFLIGLWILYTGNWQYW
ncbi:MAG: CAAX prenyl protease-related protein [Verrucomicrobia bacterium]|nr:CAAX prenyl protease-related protein [Verrucomicrobiota bacterium]MCF7707681.1 CAAX prenyl protease-related protein [Verrucomicrobiota bacterium]